MTTANKKNNWELCVVGLAPLFSEPQWKYSRAPERLLEIPSHHFSGWCWKFEGTLNNTKDLTDLYKKNNNSNPEKFWKTPLLLGFKTAQKDQMKAEEFGWDQAALKSGLVYIKGWNLSWLVPYRYCVSCGLAVGKTWATTKCIPQETEKNTGFTKDLTKYQPFPWNDDLTVIVWTRSRAVVVDCCLNHILCW